MYKRFFFIGSRDSCSSGKSIFRISFLSLFFFLSSFYQTRTGISTILSCSYRHFFFFFNTEAYSGRFCCWLSSASTTTSACDRHVCQCRYGNVKRHHHPFLPTVPLAVLEINGIFRAKWKEKMKWSSNVHGNQQVLECHSVRLFF